MSKRISKWLAGLLMVLCLSAVSGLQVQAASGSVSFNDPSATEGDTVTVNMTVSADVGLGSMDAVLTYDTSLLEFVSGGGPSTMAVSGGAGAITISWYDASGPSSVSGSLTFRTKGSGTATVSPSSVEVISIDEELVSLSSIGYSAVTITPPYQASSEARLSNLQAAPGSLSPGFSPDVYEYHMTVGSDVSRLVVSASPMDSKAHYEVSGTSLSTGDNTTTITVTAENGAVVHYTIYTYREAAEPEPTTEEVTEPTTEGESESTTESEEEMTTAEPKDPLEVIVDGETLKVSESLDGVELPEGFEEQPYVYNGEDVTAAKGLAKPLVLLWLTDADGENGAFYVYEEAGNRFFRYVSLTVAQKSYTILPEEEGLRIPKGFVGTTLTIDGELVQAWSAAKEMNSDFVLVYAMNWNGEKSLYRYDKKEGTFQRYVRETLGDGTDGTTEEPTTEAPEETQPDTDERLEQAKAEYEKELKKRAWLTWGLMALCVIELILLVVVLILWKRDDGDDDGDDDGAAEDPAAETPVSGQEERQAVNEPREAERENRAAVRQPRTSAAERRAAAQRNAQMAAQKHAQAAEGTGEPVHGAPTQTVRLDPVRPAEHPAKAPETAAETKPEAVPARREEAAHPAARPEKPAEPKPAAAAETPAEPKADSQAKPDLSDTARLDTDTYSATAALLKELEEMEFRMKQNVETAVPDLDDDDDDDDFEFVDLNE